MENGELTYIDQIPGGNHRAIGEWRERSKTTQKQKTHF